VANTTPCSCARIARLRACFSALPVRHILIIGILCLAGLPGRAVKAQAYMSIPNDKVPVNPDPVELGFVDAPFGSLHLEIPLGSYPQRGSDRPVTYKWVYDSSIWTITSNPSPAWSPTGVFSPDIQLGGWRLLPSTNYKSPIPPGYTFTLDGTCQKYYNLNWTDPAGTIHFFPITLEANTSQSCTPQSGDAFATDSSGYHMYANVGGTVSAWVYGPDGTLVYSPAVNLGTFRNPGPYRGPIDANGNYITDVGDTLNRPVSKLPNSQGGGVESSYSTAPIYANTEFGQSGVTECSQNPPHSYCPISVVQAINLSDGTSYQFKYDCDSSTGNPACGSPAGQSAYYGTLISMTLPAGGTITYTYANFKDNSGKENRVVSSRTAAGGQWQYAYTGGGQGGSSQNATITKPNGDVTTYQFAVVNGIWPDVIKYYSGAASPANLVATVLTQYDFSNSCPLTNCTGPAYIRKTQESVILTVPGGTITKQTQYTYDSPQTGNITAIKEWNFGNSTGTPDRATHMTYLTTGTNNINRPTAITVCNNSGSDPSCPGGGSKVSQTLYTYDSYGSNGLMSVTGISNHDDVGHGTSYTTRGNPTQIQRWVSGTSYLTTQLFYDTTGNIVKEIDPANNATTYGYADAFYQDNGANPPQIFTPAKPTNAFVTTVTLPPIGTNQFIQTSAYFFGSGKRAVSKDVNGVSTYFHFMDPLDRATETDFPSGWNKLVYTSATQTDSYVGIGDATPSVQCSSCRHVQVGFDSSDREMMRALVNSPLGAVNESITYDSNGRVQSASHDYISPSDPTHVFETATYGSVDRITQITHPDGSSTQTLYGSSVTTAGGISSQLCSTALYGLGFPTLSIDEIGTKKQVWTNAWGNTIEVDEPDATGSLSVATCYSYSATGQLTQSVQGTQTRTYSYDGMGRVTQETTPEAGVVALSYIASGGGLCSGDPIVPCSKTAPAPNQQNPSVTIVTTYCYDSLGRLTSKGYASSELSCPMAAPTVSYAYDQGGAAAFALGRMTKVTDSSGSETYSYDKMGNILSLQKAVGTTTYTTSYNYNAGGELTQVVYPSGRVVQQSYNHVGQLCEVAPQTTDCGTATSPFVTGYNYNAAGQFTSFNYGNGVAANLAYSPNRSQLVSLTYTKGTQTLFGLNYWYSHDSMNCVTGTTGNNGQMNCITDNVDSGRNVNYTYDPLRRLATAATKGSLPYPKWGLSETYDHYGNRWTQTVTSGSGPGISLSFGSSMNASTTNRPNGYTYDAAGNLIVEPLSPPNNYTYDNENRLTGYQGNGGTATYVYDVNDLRVQKSLQAGTTTVSIYSAGKVLAEYDNGAAPASPSREYIYAAGKLLAKIESGSTQYYHQDHLSVRLMTDSNGNKIGEEGHFPFGETWYQSNTTTKWFFTSYARDQETGLDYALARFYDNRVASFCSADPVEGDPNDPQSWNRYAYARNDPINVTDPSGKFFEFLFALFGLFSNFLGGIGQEIALSFASLGQAQLPLDATAAGEFVNLGTVQGSIVSAHLGGVLIGLTITPFPTSAVPLSVSLGSLAGQTGFVFNNVSQTGPQQEAITNRLKDIKKRLGQDSKCLQFLKGPNGEALDNLNTIIDNNLYGHADILQNGNPLTTSAVTNPGISGQAITVNNQGGFFSSTFSGGTITVGPKGLAGGTPKAQTLILLHELGHVTGILRDDGLSRKIAKANDKAIQEHCNQTINGAS
jgi:RHS repeat-associated protein